MRLLESGSPFVNVCVNVVEVVVVMASKVVLHPLPAIDEEVVMRVVVTRAVVVVHIL